MCLILVAWRQHADYSLVVAANRDEFHARATAPAARWRLSAGAPEIVGGRDRVAGGTWLAATDDGRFAALTNVRDGAGAPGRESRGHLATEFLRGSATAADYCRAVAAACADPGRYAGFNLLVGDGRELCHFSNRGDGVRRLPPGIYGVSNHLLDTPWPKLTTAKAAFAAALATLTAADAVGGSAGVKATAAAKTASTPPDLAPFLALLADREIVADARLPATGVPLAWERLLSAVFVCSPDYGTRASSVLLQSENGAGHLFERSFAPDGRASGDVSLPLGRRR